MCHSETAAYSPGQLLSRAIVSGAEMLTHMLQCCLEPVAVDMSDSLPTMLAACFVVAELR